MRDLFGSCIVAFSMYSALPMPKMEWTEKNMRYPLCFFPLIGLPIGGCFYLYQWFCGQQGIGTILFAAGAVAIPLLITGGIHLDGFCDTVDALASHQDRERMLEILKDPHIGAFGVLGLCLYLLLQFALFTEFPMGFQGTFLLGLGYCFSRALSGFAVVTFPCAKNSGLVYAFADGAARGQVGWCLAAWLVLLAAAMLYISPVVGGGVIAATLLTFIVYRAFSARRFGGITGDLAGWFLQWCELAMLAVIVLLGRGIL